jgi:hypothetical protein
MSAVDVPAEEPCGFRASTRSSANLAFTHPGHPSAPPGPERFNGQGMCLEFQLEDAWAVHERLAREGAPITLSLFAVLPFARFVYMMVPGAGGAPRILAGFGDWRGAEGYPTADPDMS